MKKFGDDLDKDATQFNQEIKDSNEFREKILAIQKEVNDQIGQSEFKLKFHQEKEQTLVAEG